MDDETFLAFVGNNAPRCEAETLKEAVKKLNANIASRIFGKPEGLEVGSHVRAQHLTAPIGWYGTVIRHDHRACTIESPESKHTQRIPFKKYIVRIIDEFEWNRACMAAASSNREFIEKLARDRIEIEADREAAIRERPKGSVKTKTMLAINGAVRMFRGAFVHAYRPDWGSHSYGVVITMTPKSIVLSSPESPWPERIVTSKHEIELLDDTQWQLVDYELRRRKEELEAAETAGKAKQLPDFNLVQIPLK